jgi:hypothetical protein
VACRASASKCGATPRCLGALLPPRGIAPLRSSLFAWSRGLRTCKMIWSLQRRGVPPRRRLRRRRCRHRRPRRPRPRLRRRVCLHPRRSNVSPLTGGHRRPILRRGVDSRRRTGRRIPGGLRCDGNARSPGIPCRGHAAGNARRLAGKQRGTVSHRWRGGNRGSNRATEIGRQLERRRGDRRRIHARIDAGGERAVNRPDWASTTASVSRPAIGLEGAGLVRRAGDAIVR